MLYRTNNSSKYEKYSKLEIVQISKLRMKQCLVGNQKSIIAFRIQIKFCTVKSVNIQKYP